MPNQDGTGPQGKGPIAGRHMGPCFNQVTKFSTKEELENYQNNLNKQLKEVEKALRKIDKK